MFITLIVLVEKTYMLINEMVANSYAKELHFI